MIFKKYKLKQKLNEDKNKIIIYSNSPTGRDENIPRLLINQLSPKAYLILPLKDMQEDEFSANTFKFSFGIPRLVFPNYSGIGDIFFFKESGFEFSRINIVDIFNLNQENVSKVEHKFSKSNLKTLDISLFKEDDYVYYVKIFEIAYSGRLRETWSNFVGKIDLKNNIWLNVDGQSSLECFK